MSENYWFTKVIPSCVACSGVIFGVIQYMQVAPLKADLAKEQEKVRVQKTLVKTSKEYQNLQTLYLEEKAKRELRDEELKGTARIEVEKIKLEIEFEGVKKRLAKLEKYSDYDAVVGKLTSTEKRLAEYELAYSELLSRAKELQKKLSLDDDLQKLNKEKSRLETILDCMVKGCNGNVFYSKYDDKYEPVAFEQYKSQLRVVNKKIEIIYTSLAKN
ncbi:hypothetical protein QUN95_004647 [Vibrio parahaemolyticus]|nr:hypothetical protein [Vibrio parahaemolyticus]EKM6953972.1 hypothetical protein [Vibrio parahaemolyticus]ELA9354864.1 hypothetical protein [Vibrio parahaemolyticus]